MFGQSLLSAFGSAACTTDTDQLFQGATQDTTIATYQLNNATTSIPSNTYPGTPKNLTYVTGKFGDAANFVRTGNGNTTTSAIYLPNNSFNSATSYSLSAWVNLPNFNSTGVVFSNYFYNGSNEYGYKIYPNTSGNLTVDNWSPSITRKTSTSSLSVNTWHNITVTNTQSQIKIYIDGILDSTHSTSGYAFDTTMLYTIGGTQYNGLTYDGFNGKIDQFRFFNSVLPQAAVTALYNETTTTATYPYVDYIGPNPNSVAYYKMSDATDQLGNYNGTASNVNFNTVGKFGFAGAFNGSSSSIQMPNDSFNYTTMSFSAWVNPSANDAFNYIFQNGMYDNRIGGSIGWYVRREQGGKLLARGFSSNSLSGYEFEVTSASGLIPLNTWTNVVCVLTPTSFNIYVNGNSTAVASATFTNSITYSASQPVAIHVGISYYYYNGAAYEYSWEGAIDQIRIYDSALSAANVTALYNEIECPDDALITVDYLVVGGGGSAGVYSLGSSGGGAGGVKRTSNYGGSETVLIASKSTAYNVTVGDGGVSPTTSASGNNGTSSLFNGITSIGGGGGGSNGTTDFNGLNGASGGGGGPWDTNKGAGGTGSDGYNGGKGNSAASCGGAGCGGGGGGGFTSAGGNVNGATPNGGTGVEVNIIGGTGNFYAGGGGGAKLITANYALGGTGGSGVGGDSALASGGAGVSGTVNTGSGGGGGFASTAGNGGSGVVILRYPSANSITVGSGLSTGVLNGTVSGGTDKYTTFTLGSGTITFS